MGLPTNLMISIHQYPHHRADFLKVIDLIREYRQKDPSSKLYVAYGNVWNSNKYFLDDPRMEKFCDYLHEVSSNLRVETSQQQGWINSMEPGSYLDDHNHKDGRNILSGVYYLTNGDIIFDGYGTVKAIPGTILMFPPKLSHHVVTTKLPRVTIAFNLW